MTLSRHLCILVAMLSVCALLAPPPVSAQTEIVIASDNFNRADEAPFVVGGNWGRTVAGNYDGVSHLVGQQVTSVSNEGIYYWRGAGTFSGTRQFARQRVVQKDGELGLVLLGGPDHAIMVGWGPPGVGSTVYIYWYSGGLDRGQLATGPSTISNGDTIEAVLDGGVIYAKVNGVTVKSVANTTTLTSGTPGFITYLDPDLPGQVSILDDWEAGTPPSYSISGTITENSAGLSGVLVSASGGFSGNATTNGSGAYTLTGVPSGASSILLTPTLSGHLMSPLTRTVTGPVAANVTGQDFTSTLNTGYTLTVNASHGSVTRDPGGTSYASGTEVTLTPVPDGGYAFASWSGDVPAGHETDNPLHVTMDQDRTITGHFTSPDVIASDDFNRANETPLTVGGSGNWQQPFGGGFDNLTSNQVVSASGEALYYWQGSGAFSNTRQFARLKVVQASGQVGLVLLGSTTNSQALVVSWGAGRLYIYWYLNGSHHGELANEVSVIHDGDVIEGAIDNGTIYTRINGVTVKTVPNTTSLTSGQPGFETYQTGAVFDDWEAGTPPSYSISGTITENSAGLSGVLVSASGGFSGNATTNASGAYTLTGVPSGASSILLTPTLSGHLMSPLTRTVAGPVAANVTGQDFTSALNTGYTLTVNASHGSVTRDPGGTSYASGTEVTLTPVPDGGYAFASWSGDVPAGHETDNPLHVTMDQDRTITGHFTSPDVIASDDFNRANETPLTVGGSGNWQQPFGGGFDNLTSNQVVSASGEALYYWQGSGAFSNTRQFARLKVVQASGQVGLVLLGSTTNSQALVVSWGAGRLYIYWYLNGSHHGELANEVSVIHDGDVIEGAIDNGTIYARINGVTVKTVPNTTSLTSGQPGFETYQTGAVFDDWEAGTPPSYSISGTITENSAGLSGVLVSASGGFSGNATTNASGAYTLTGVPSGASSILLTPTLSGHLMSPLTRTVAGPVAANVTGQDFTSAPAFALTTQAAFGSVTRDPDATSYAGGTDVTLTPLPRLGYAFASWSGDVPTGHETDNPLHVTMDQNRTVTAHFSASDVVASDDFNRANETPLTVGGNWQQPFSGGFDHLTGNQVVGTSAEALYYWQGSGTFSSTRQFARLKVVQASGQVGLVLLGASNQALVVAWHNGTLYFYWYLGGSYQGNIATTASTLQNGDVIEALLDNGTIYAKINGTTVASTANLTTLTSGRPGFETFEAGAILDDWDAGPPPEVTTYPIVASAGTGGTINPNGSVYVTAGATQTFLISPASCYTIAGVVVDGNPVGAVASYTFTNVQANHTIAASFVANAPTVTAVTDLAAAPQTTGNDADGTTKVALTFSPPVGAATIEVWRKGYGNYPRFDDAPGSGSAPSPPGSYPPAGWTLTAVTASGQSDEPAARDVWYYVAYAKDACGNVSTVSTMTAGTLDYLLGDVSDGVTLGQGDNQVSGADVSLLGLHYGTSGVALAGVEYLDVGPTSDGSVHSRPTTDGHLEFEDLVVFAINYTTSLSVAIKGGTIGGGGANLLTAQSPAAVQAGEDFDVPLMLDGAGDLVAISITLDWDPAVVEPVGGTAGDLIAAQGGVVFSPGRGRADAALMGASHGMAGQGAVATMRFRALAAGAPGITIGRVIGRDLANREVTVATQGTLGVGAAVTATELRPVTPNPARGLAGLDFTVAVRGPVDLSIYSVNGRRVQTLAHGIHEVGRYHVTWNGRDERGSRVNAGVFFVRLEAPGYRKTRTLSLVH